MIKSIASYLTLTLTICILMYISFSSNETVDLSKYSTKGLELNYTVSQEQGIQDDVLASNDLNESFSPYLGKTFVGFKEALAFKESRGDYSSVNTFGYLGKYQFGSETLKMIGIYNPAQDALASAEIDAKQGELQYRQANTIYSKRFSKQMDFAKRY